MKQTMNVKLLYYKLIGKRPKYDLRIFQTRSWLTKQVQEAQFKATYYKEQESR